MRKGLSTFSQFGNPNKYVARINNQLTNNIDNVDGTELEECNKYIEESKDNLKTNVTHRNYTIDYILDLINEYKVKTYQDFMRKIPESVQIELYRISGVTNSTMIQKLIMLTRTKQKQTLKYTDYVDIILQNYNIESVNFENVQWLNQLLLSNNIQPQELLAKFILVKNMTLQKINTFVIQGVTNTGKSMFLNLLLEDCDAATITREKGKTSFHLDELPTSTVVLFEEPVLDPTNIGTWKSLIEGAKIQTDIKHSNKEPIPRLPIFITTMTYVYGVTSTKNQY